MSDLVENRCRVLVQDEKRGENRYISPIRAASRWCSGNASTSSPEIYNRDQFPSIHPESGLASGRTEASAQTLAAARGFFSWRGPARSVCASKTASTAVWSRPWSWRPTPLWRYMPLTVLLVDDEPLAREGLRILLARDPDIGPS